MMEKNTEYIKKKKQKKDEDKEGYLRDPEMGHH